MHRYQITSLMFLFMICSAPNVGDAFEPDTPLANAPVSYRGANNYRYTGWSISAGDVDGDGINDLLIGGRPVYLILGKNIGTTSGTTIEDLADASFTAENSGDDFGDAVCMTGDVNNDGFDDILIGADRYNNSTGKTYLILGKASGWSMNTPILDAAEATFTGENQQDVSGYALSFAGDINHDGFDDFLVGAYLVDVGSLVNAGRTYLFMGKAGGWSGDLSVTDADATVSGVSAGGGFGRKVAPAGDVNHDGYDDFLIAAPGDKTYLLLGKSGGWSGDIDLGTADASFIGESVGDSSGFGIGCAGDVNHDGYDDILIGADYNDTYANNAGKVYLIFGKSAGWAADTGLAAADASFYGEAADDHLGEAVSSAGDVNNDGFDDFLIGAPWAGQWTGKAYLILGKAAGWAFDTPVSTADASFLGEAPYDYAGFAMSTAGDIDRDGNDEFMISAAYFGSYYTGKVYLYYGDGPVVGDLNADRVADIADAIIGLQILVDSEQPVVFENGSDVNGDGTIGVEEVIFDLQKAAGLR